MARDFDQIAAAAAHVQASQVADETTSLPPGYIEGFEPTLNPDYTVNIKAGIAYIAGRAVKMEADHLLAGEDWVAPRLDHPNHYYIYLDKSGSFRVDLVKPVYNRGYAYYEQPDFGWRAIAKIFLKNNNIIYCSSEVTTTGFTVTVAPNGYTGQADYYCTGTNDQIMINAAILYVYSAYYGGLIRLLEGTFITSAAIVFYSNISLKGNGNASIIYPTSQTFNILSAIGTSGSYLSNINISDLCLYTELWSTLSLSIYNINFDYVSNTTVSNVLFKKMGGTICFAVFNSLDIIVTNCIWDGENVTNVSDMYAFYCESSARVLISTNVFKNAKGDGISVYGVWINGGGSGCEVSNNTFYNFTTPGTADCIGIRVSADNVKIFGNKIEALDTADNGTPRAIYIVSGNRNSVVSNYCYNNGSDTGIANTNNRNFYDAGTDTQTYSNSWQTPVAGEPSLGEKKRKRVRIISTTTISCSTSYSVSLATTSAPVGTKSVSLEVYYTTAFGGGSCPIAFGTTSTDVISMTRNRNAYAVTDHLDTNLNSLGNFKFWLPGTTNTNEFDLYMTHYSL